MTFSDSFLLPFTVPRVFFNTKSTHSLSPNETYSVSYSNTFIFHGITDPSRCLNDASTEHAESSHQKRVYFSEERSNQERYAGLTRETLDRLKQNARGSDLEETRRYVPGMKIIPVAQKNARVNKNLVETERDINLERNEMESPEKAVGIGRARVAIIFLRERVSSIG